MRSVILNSPYPNDIVVIGGVSNQDSQVVLASTEIFRENAWMSGPDFPMPIYATNVQQYDRGKYFSFCAKNKV